MFTGMIMDLISLIALVVGIASLTSSIYFFIATKEARILSGVRLKKENAKFLLIRLGQYIQDYRDKLAKASSSKERENIITYFRMNLPISTTARELALIHVYYPIVPKSLMDMIFEKDFFEDETKLDNFIAQIRKSIKELS